VKTILLLIATCALAATPLCSAAADNLVANGDFENGKDNAFHSTSNWYNIGEGLRQDYNARTNMGVLMSGFFAATVNDRYDSAAKKFGPVAHSQKTGYAVKEGDIFTLNYAWRPYDYNWQPERDTIRFVLYATSDDKVRGPVLWSSTLTSDFFKGSINVAKVVSQKTTPVTAAAAGKKLFVVFHGIDTVDGVKGETNFARVDNIVVTSSRAPEQPAK
jgi:hypothetical protein